MTEPTNTAISVETTAPVNQTVAVNTTQVSANNAPTAAPIQDWRSGLSEDLKEAKALSNFKDQNDLAKSYLHLSSLLGKKVNEWASDDIKGLYGKLGRPEAADKYEFPTDMGQDIAALKQMAFNAGLNQEQAKSLADQIVLANRQMVEQKQAEEKNQFEEATSSLKKEFGSAFDKRLELAKRALDQLGGDSLKKVLAGSGLDNNPEVVKFFANLGKSYLEEHSIVNADKSSVHGITPDEAKKLIEIERKSNAQAIINRNHPDHLKVKTRMDELYKMAYSGSVG